MDLLLGEKLRELRRTFNITQEEVADALNVSFQAVSKWERGDGYPDITLLPMLADFFGVTVDELLGKDEAVSREKYSQMNQTWLRNNILGRHSENAILMREALRLYPNDALLLIQLATSLQKLDGTDEEKRANLRKSIALMERIVNYSDDCEERASALYNLCFSYAKNGEHQKAVEQAWKQSNLYQSRENALVHLLAGDARHDVAHGALMPLAYGLSLHLRALAETESNPAHRQKIGRIFDILFEGVRLEPSEEAEIRSLRERAE